MKIGSVVENPFGDIGIVIKQIGGLFNGQAEKFTVSMDTNWR